MDVYLAVPICNEGKDCSEASMAYPGLRKAISYPQRIGTPDPVPVTCGLKALIP